MDTQITNIQGAFALAMYEVFSTILAFLPQLLAAFVLVIFGRFCGQWARWLVIRLVRAMGLDKILKGSPIDKILEKAEITKKIEDFVGDGVKWLVILIFFISAINVLGLTTVSNFLSNVLSYLPQVFAAILILVVGIMVAGFVESLVKGGLRQISLSTARLLAKMSSYIIMVFTVLAALAQLGIAENLINILFVGFVAMLALGFGLAFGLGAKDLVSKILDEWYRSLKHDN